MPVLYGIPCAATIVVAKSLGRSAGVQPLAGGAALTSNVATAMYCNYLFLD